MAIPQGELPAIPVYTHFLALICALIITALILFLPTSPEAIVHHPQAHSRPVRDVLPLPVTRPQYQALVPTEPVTPDHQWHSVVVNPGDNLSTIFARLGLRADDLYQLLSQDEEFRALSRLLPGQALRVRANPEGKLLELVHEYDRLRGLRLTRENDAFSLSRYTRDTEQRLGFAVGVIDSSFYQTARSVDLPDTLIIKMAEIFGWDIDFALDIRAGDSFVVLYEEDYIDGEKIGDGEIVAAEFVNRGQTHRAVRYQHDNGKIDYLTPEGRPMRQRFLRAPVDFRRISSHFQPERWHPVLGVRRPHRGVDYAAPVGTPIQAAGDGTVISIGHQGGYGNTVVLKHGSRYTTLYAHLSRYRRGLSQGDRVRQGDIIGYVGQTGLATGPHLHYEFRIDGVHQNPVTVDLPGPEPLEPGLLTDFHIQAEPWVQRLDQYRRLALKDPQLSVVE